MTRQELAQYLEHTLLRPNATEAGVRRVCCEAADCGCHAVVVDPARVAIAVEELSGSSIKVVTVAGFPLGACRSETKIVEAIRGAIDGASEIDMVAAIGWLIDGEWRRAEDEIAQVRRTLPGGTILKVIIEAPLLNPQQQADATRVVINGGAQFVKTGTGFFGPVTVDQVRVLTSSARGFVQVKAAGGIRTIEQCRDLIEAGASRLGCSASYELLQSLPE
ncbi:MAG: deoxyribose-phosphate aldolase [candidate division Zixibacteria bacterium]|nr:deoxyribose-phosphate aldolase [candidate division Zixibacteria bacterium]